MNDSTEIAVLLAAISDSRPNISNVDQGRLFQLAQYHRLTPQLSALGSLFSEAARLNAVNSLALFASTANVLNAFAAHGLPALAIKGPVLAYVLRGDLSARVCTDADVLVRRADALDCARILSDLGFTCTIPVEADAFARHFVYEHDLQFMREDGTLLELHVDIAQRHYSYRIALDDWFEQSRVIEFGGRRIKTLNAERTALLATIHGTKHAWSRLDLVRDFADLRQSVIDWRIVIAEARAVGAMRALRVAAALTAELIGWAPPVESITTADQRLAAAVADRLRNAGEQDFWATRLFDFRIRERSSDRIRYALYLGLSALKRSA